MRVVGIVAEYNPFHTGHEYHLREAKRAADADYAVVVMSPDFVQRGEPAIFDKYVRTGMALRGGADLVLELPAACATGSAESFATGAVSLLDASGAADALCFGAETAELRLFERTARVLNEEPEPYRLTLQDGLRQGLTFPQARSQALAAYMSTEQDFLASPNNILGIEYCRALQRLHSAINPVPVTRVGSAFNSTALDDAYCSATALRHAVARQYALQHAAPEQYALCHAAAASAKTPEDACADAALRYIPESCRSLFEDACRQPVFADDFLPYLTWKLLTTDDFTKIADISPSLSDRIQKLRFQCIGKSFGETVDLLRTKQLTEARVRRALLHLILDIRAESEWNVIDTRQTDRPHNGHASRAVTARYARILGFRQDAAPLLHELKKRSRIPLLSKPARALSQLDAASRNMWLQDVSASHLYRAVLSQKYGLPFKTEYEYSPLRLQRLSVTPDHSSVSFRI